MSSFLKWIKPSLSRPHLGRPHLSRPHLFTLLLLLSVTPLVSSKAPDEDVKSTYDRQTEQLRLDQRVISALDHILTLEVQSTRDLIELTQIPAPPFKEQARGIRFAEMLGDAGLIDVTIDAVGNVIGRRPGTQTNESGKRIVAYSAHLDTVFPIETDVTVRVVGNRLFAPGIGDNTRGLVNILAVLRAMEFAAIETPADIWFIGNVGEEGLGDLRGVKYLFRDGTEPIDSLIAIDGGESSRIVYGGIGSHRYRITFKGPGGHSWGDFGLANPHHALGRAIALFDEQALILTKTFEQTSYNIGRIGGGTSVNSIPFESWMEVDLRSDSQDNLNEIDALLQSSVQRALEEENQDRAIGVRLTVGIDRVGTRPASKGDKKLALVQKAMAATRSFGITPSLLVSSTDANLPLSKGIPAITMSRGGSGGRAHSLNEWWENNEGHVGIQIGLMTLLLEAGLKPE